MYEKSYGITTYYLRDKNKLEYTLVGVNELGMLHPVLKTVYKQALKYNYYTMSENYRKTNIVEQKTMLLTYPSSDTRFSSSYRWFEINEVYDDILKRASQT